MTYYSLSDYESYWGKLEIVKSKKHTDNYDYTLKNSKGDIFYVGTGVVSIDSNYTCLLYTSISLLSTFTEASFTLCITKRITFLSFHQNTTRLET